MTARASISSGSLYSSNGQRKYLTTAERSRFIAAAISCPRRELRTLCLVLAYTGCRISEALSLTTASIETTENFVAVKCLKKRKGTLVVRELPLPPTCVKLLGRVHHLNSSRHNERLWPWCRSRAWQLVKSVMKSAGLSDGIHATPKGLRHGFGLHAIRSGVPLHLVQRWLGHARLETTTIYLQVIGAEELQFAKLMWSGCHAPTKHGL